MRGPFTHSQNEEYALLVDGFDAPPAVQLAYNPPYYAELLEGYGLRRAHDLHAWWADADREPDARLLRVAAAIRARGRITVRPLRLADYDAEVDRAELLLNEVLEQTRGFVPVTSAELRFAARQFRALFRPELVLFAEVDGVPAGIVLAMPDFNQALARVPDGRLLPFGWLRIARGLRRSISSGCWRWASGPPTGGGGSSCCSAWSCARRRGASATAAASCRWSGRTTTPIHRTIAAMGGRRTKTYRIYEVRAVVTPALNPTIKAMLASLGVRPHVRPRRGHALCTTTRAGSTSTAGRNTACWRWDTTRPPSSPPCATRWPRARPPSCSRTAPPTPRRWPRSWCGARRRGSRAACSRTRARRRSRRRSS